MENGAKYLEYDAYKKQREVAMSEMAAQIKEMNQRLGIVDPVITNPLRMPHHLVEIGSSHPNFNRQRELREVYIVENCVDRSEKFLFSDIDQAERIN